MNDKSQQSEELADALAEGIAAVMAANEELEGSEDTVDMADLFLEELNRLWAEAPAAEAA